MPKFRDLSNGACFRFVTEPFRTIYPVALVLVPPSSSGADVHARDLVSALLPPGWGLFSTVVTAPGGVSDQEVERLRHPMLAPVPTPADGERS